MTVGDVLEWLAAAAVAAAAFLWAGPVLALVVLGVVLAYEAQCYDSAVPPIHPVRAMKARRAKRAQAKMPAERTK